MNFLNPTGQNDQPVQAKITMTMKRGDVLRHELAGAAGWGDPLERDPNAVLRDVRNEMISVDTARRDYGVAVDIDTWSIDESETKKLRKAIEQARGWTEVPSVLREDPVGLSS